MSSRFSLQTPYVVTSLPRPIDHSNGRYVVGDVYGSTPGSKKRKRSELAVGVDGEGVDLFDISSSRLITSYALPPQTCFTCPPTSLRTKFSTSKVERRTYVSTGGLQSQVTLFLDMVNGPTTNSSLATRKVENSREPIVYMRTITPTGGSNVSDTTSDLLVVKEDGEIQCLDGATLEMKWTSPAEALHQESTSPFTSTDETKVEFVYLTNACAAIQGILKGRQDVFTLFPQEISQDGFNPDVLVIIAKSTSSRTLHIVTFPRRSATHLNGLKNSVESLLAANLPSPKNCPFSSKASFSLQVSAGVLQQLSSNTLTTFDLNGTLPKEVSQMRSTGAQSFLRLSSMSIMASSETSITVYNPKFQSILASIQLNGSLNSESSRRKQRVAEETNEPILHTRTLVSYFPKLGTAVGIFDSDLVGIQIEGQQWKGRAAGLLIDSLGCSITDQIRPGSYIKGAKETGLRTMESYLPGSVGAREAPWEEQTKPFEEAFSKGNTNAFDVLLEGKFGGWGKTTTTGRPLVNGCGPSNKNKRPQITASEIQLPPADVDRRWIIYALSKIFSWSKEDGGEYRLSIRFYPPNSFMWLLGTGNMTVAQIESALRNEIRFSPVDSIPAGCLVDALVEIDPEIDLLLVLLARNFLGAAELLSAIRHLMESLELLGDNSSTKRMLPTNGEESELGTGDLDEQVKKLEAEAEADLALAEYQLGPGSGVRGEALSLALSKLYTCPTHSIVHALQTTFASQEIVALIYLLRFELARGSWTTRYLDADQSGVGDEATDIPDNSIILVSSLLSNCVDAVGAGGWLAGDTRLVNGDPFEAEELIASLKLEVSAALEGIEEAAYLRGLTSEMIRYGDAVLNGLPNPVSEAPADKKRKTSNQKPVLLPSSKQDMKTLPLGLKADQKISLLRLGAGGEIQERSSRAIGRLKSQKVGKYSLERIII